MDKLAAIIFLKNNQPFPDSSLCRQSAIDAFAGCIDYFSTTLDHDLIPLLLGCYGNGDMFGLYGVLETIFTRIPTEFIVPHLRSFIASPHPSVRSRNCMVASAIGAKELLPLMMALAESDDDQDVRYWATDAAAIMGGVHIMDFLRHRLSRESNPDLIAMITDCIRELESPNQWERPAKTPKAPRGGR